MISLTKALLVVACAQLAAGAPQAGDPGAALSKLLGFSDQQEAAAAVAKMGAGPSQPTSNGLRVPEQVEQRLQRFAQLVRQTEEPLERVQKEAGELVDVLQELHSGGVQRALEFAAWTRLSLVHRLQQAGLPMDAAIELRRLECQCRQLASACASYNLFALRHQLDAALEQAPPASLLGLQPGSDQRSRAKLALRRYQLQVHPDKNGHLDEEARRQMSGLFNRLQEAYRSIVG